MDKINKETNNKSKLNHLDKNNNPTMVDVSAKEITQRIAHARTEVIIPQILWAELKDGDIKTKKGPIFHTAVIAGTMAVKKTPDLIPFCHPLIIESCKIKITPNQKEKIIYIDCKVKISGKTGVEMEALTGATIAALAIYDMGKAITHEIVIGKTYLVEKKGGKRLIVDGKNVQT